MGVVHAQGGPVPRGRFGAGAVRGELEGSGGASAGTGWEEGYPADAELLGEGGGGGHPFSATRRAQHCDNAGNRCRGRAGEEVKGTMTHAHVHDQSPVAGRAPHGGGCGVRRQGAEGSQHCSSTKCG